MNAKVEHIVRAAYAITANTKSKDPSQWIDAFVLELLKKVVFACSDVVREQAKSATPEVAAALKIAAVDMLEEFGL